MKEKYIKQIYSGWLGKIIGIRLGAPIEGWTYEKIKNVYGTINDYLVNYNDFAADDDSNGPIFFIRALEDKKNEALEANDIAEALLNYAPFEHGFFWWGGYGIATEHTAYTNLLNGISAPMSGSIEQNGISIAEQIGGQIFIDSWGLVNPGNPDRAAKQASLVASVTHDGNGIYGGVFVAVCISYAFIENNIKKIIEKGLSYIPKDCEYSKVARKVIDFYDNDLEKDFRKCFKYIYDNFGYDKYPGNCHIIPNMAVMILAMLYGNGDFEQTILICNMCGWDTDCNVGNVATILGVKNGIDGIDHKWIEPINDFLACSSVIGSLNIMDIPYGALYMTKLAYELDNQELPEVWNDIVTNKINWCNFELPGSTHAIRTKIDTVDDISNNFKAYIKNTDETSFTGKRSLKIICNQINAGDDLYVYRKTYYHPSDFYDSRYNPSFSPTVYPGDTINCAVMLPEYSNGACVSLYAYDSHNDKKYFGKKITLTKNSWEKLSFSIPSIKDGLIEEIGICFHTTGIRSEKNSFVAFIDDLYVVSTPNYNINFQKEYLEKWNSLHEEISQFSRYKGQLFLENNCLNLSCADIGEAYTGNIFWENYNGVFKIKSIHGEYALCNVRVQGGMRSYGIGLLPNNRFVILKKDRVYSVLAETDFNWIHNKEYEIIVSVNNNQIEASIDGIKLTVIDSDNPYLNGCIGLTTIKGSRLACSEINIF